jgi:hypothetical protein
MFGFLAIIILFQKNEARVFLKEVKPILSLKVKEGLVKTIHIESPRRSMKTKTTIGGNTSDSTAGMIERSILLDHIHGPIRGIQTSIGTTRDKSNPDRTISSIPSSTCRVIDSYIKIPCW